MIIGGKTYWGPSLFPELDLMEFPGGMHNWEQRVTCDHPLVRPTVSASTKSEWLSAAVPESSEQA